MHTYKTDVCAETITTRLASVIDLDATGCKVHVIVVDLVPPLVLPLYGSRFRQTHVIVTALNTDAAALSDAEYWRHSDGSEDGAIGHHKVRRIRHRRADAVGGIARIEALVVSRRRAKHQISIGTHAGLGVWYRCRVEGGTVPHPTVTVFRTLLIM